MISNEPADPPKPLDYNNPLVPIAKPRSLAARGFWWGFGTAGVLNLLLVITTVVSGTTSPIFLGVFLLLNLPALPFSYGCFRLIPPPQGMAAADGIVWYLAMAGFTAILGSFLWGVFGAIATRFPDGSRRSTSRNAGLNLAMTIFPGLSRRIIAHHIYRTYLERR